MRLRGGDAAMTFEIDFSRAHQYRWRLLSDEGEVALSGDSVWGVSVHVAARILAEAGSGEVLLSGTTRDLAEGAAGLTFESRGRYRLKGLDREHELFAATSATK